MTLDRRLCKIDETLTPTQLVLRWMTEAHAFGDLMPYVEGHPLLELPGAGPITVARLVAEAGDMRRFRTPDAFAALAGVAPIPASSGQVQRMRLNRGGNRQLNRALHIIAVTQSRFHPPAKAYVTRRIEADGKTWREAIRALKRQLVRPVFRLLVEGSEVRLEAA